MPALPPSTGKDSTGMYAQRSDAPPGPLPGPPHRRPTGKRNQYPVCRCENRGARGRRAPALNMAHPTPAHTAAPSSRTEPRGRPVSQLCWWPRDRLAHLSGTRPPSTLGLASVPGPAVTPSGQARGLLGLSPPRGSGPPRLLHEKPMAAWDPWEDRRRAASTHSAHCAPGKGLGGRGLQEMPTEPERSHVIRQQGAHGSQCGGWKQRVRSRARSSEFMTGPLCTHPHSRLRWALPLPNSHQTQPHPPSPRRKALLFKGPRKVLFHHPYSASVSPSAKWADTSACLSSERH